MRNRISTLLATIAGVLVAGEPIAQQGEIEALRDALAVGRWTKRLETAYGDFALARARDNAGKRVSAKFFAWVDQHAEIRERLVWMLAVHPESTKSLMCLERLRDAHEAQVLDMPDLAIGFALSWSGGEVDSAPERRWSSWRRGREATPTIEESFAWYGRERKRLAFPVRSTCWKLAAYVALNDVPLNERAWVLQRYRGKKVAQMREVFGEVPYVAGGLDGKAETLANMVQHGGVCTVNTQYQMCVMRTLGIPATYSGGPGHCWPSWIAGKRRAYEFDRVNDLGNADGTIGEWGVPGHRYESDLRLLARALSKAESSVRSIDITAAALDAVGNRVPPRGVEILTGLLERNPYAVRGWLALASTIARGAVSQRVAGVVLRKLRTELEEFPAATLRVLEACVPVEPRDSVASVVVQAFERAVGSVARTERLAKQARRALVSFLVNVGQRERADRLRLELLLKARGDGVGFFSSNGRSPKVGGSGGSEFEDRAPQDGRLVGLRYTLGDYFGHRVVASLQPLYRIGARVVPGKRFGDPNGQEHEVMAPDGYEVAGLEAVGGDRVDGFAALFGRTTEEGVDLEDVRFSEWVGGGSTGVLLGASGVACVGVFGRSGGQLDALGLCSARAAGK